MVVICSLSPQQTCGTWHSFRAFGVCWTRLSLSPPLGFQAWSPVPQPQGWASVESLPTWTSALTEKSCLCHYQFPSPPSLCFDAFSCTSKASALRSLIKKSKGILLNKIKTRFTRLKTAESGIQVEKENLWSVQYTGKKYSFPYAPGMWISNFVSWKEAPRSHWNSWEPDT